MDRDLHTSWASIFRDIDDNILLCGCVFTSFKSACHKLELFEKRKLQLRKISHLACVNMCGCVCLYVCVENFVEWWLMGLGPLHYGRYYLWDGVLGHFKKADCAAVSNKAVNSLPLQSLHQVLSPGPSLEFLPWLWYGNISKVAPPLHRLLFPWCFVSSVRPRQFIFLYPPGHSRKGLGNFRQTHCGA